MAWENRSGNSYYYRKVRIGRRVVSQYVGSGWLAEQEAERDQVDRERREAERESQRLAREQARAIDSDLDQVGELTRALLRASLLLAGCYPYKRQWRVNGER